MKNNRIKVLPILSTIGVLILAFTLCSCAMLGLSTAKKVESFYLEAEALADSGYYNAAIEKYKVALKEFRKPGVTLGLRPHIDDNFPTLVNYKIAVVYSKLAQQSDNSKQFYNNAIEYAEKVALLPTNNDYKAKSYQLWAELLYTTGEFELAIKRFSELIEHFPESLFVEEASYRIGMIYDNLGNHELSQIAFKQLLSKFPFSHFKHEVHYRIAEVFLKAEHYEQAHQEFTKSLKSKIYSSDFREDALYRAIYCLHQLGRYDEALSQYSAFAKRYPNSQYTAELSQYALSMGKFYFRIKQYEKALSGYQLALQNTQKQPLKTEIQLAIAEAHLAIGKVYFGRKDYEKALSSYQSALQNTQKQPLKTEIQLAIMAEAHLAIGKVYFGRKDYEKALSSYQSAIQNTQKQPLKTEIQLAMAEAHLAIGKVYFGRKDYEKALSSYQSALQNTQKQPLKTEIQLAITKAHFAIGKTYFVKKDYKSALSSYQLALQSTEKQSLKTEIQLAITKAHFAIGKTYFVKKDYKSALSSYQLALQSTEKQSLKTEIQLAMAEAYLAIGKTYFGKKDYENALSSYQLALHNTENLSLKTEIQLAMVFAYLNRSDAKNTMDTCKRMLSVTETDPTTILTVELITKERLTIAKGIQLYLEAETTPFLAGYKGAVAKYNAALTEIQKSISTTVGAEYQADLNYILGNLFYKVERFESAEQQLTKVISDFPDSNFVDDAWYAIGDMNYKLQSYTECRDAFRKILESFPNSDLQDDAQYFVAKSLLEELDYEGAYLAFDGLTTKRFQKYPDFQDDTRYHAAYCLNLLGRDDMAIRWYANFLAHYPKSPYRVNAYFDLGTIYARQQNYENARSNYAWAMQHTDDQALLSEIQMAIGHAHYNQGDYENAIVTHTSLLEKYPESDFIIEAKLGIANSHFRMRTWQEAADAYERVINEHPEATNFTPYCAYQVGEAHYGLATDHSEQDKTELAVKNFHKALEWYQRIIDDFPVENSNNLGEITGLLITSLARMCNDPGVPEELQSLAQVKKGDCYLATKQFGKALAEYNTFVQMFPNSTRSSSVQDRIKQVQESIISKNLRQEKVSTAVDVPIEQQIAQKALASTMLILTTDATGDPMALGSGFFISDDQIVSNWHVVEGATTAYALSVDEKTRYKIEGILAMNPKQDLVILKISGEGSPLPLGDSNIIQIGESIYVTGNPKGWTGTFSIGVISSFQMRYAGKRIQITAPVSPGSSGGPVLNDKGEVIGVVYAVHGGPDAQNLNLAIPVNYLKALLKRVGPPIPLSVR